MGDGKLGVEFLKEDHVNFLAEDQAKEVLKRLKSASLAKQECAYLFNYVLSSGWCWKRRQEAYFPLPLSEGDGDIYLIPQSLRETTLDILQAKIGKVRL